MTPSLCTTGEECSRPIVILALLSRVTEVLDDAALEAAFAALRSRQDSPSASLDAARRILDSDDISGLARLVALWAQALAERELNRLPDAELHLRAAIAVGEELADRARVAQLTSALVSVVAARGRSDEALAIADSVGDDLPVAERGDLEMKRAMVIEQLGRPAEAVEAYTRALALIVRGDDRVLEARLRCNRSVVLAHRGQIDEALTDALIAERLAVDNGQFFLAGGAAHNHGFTAGLQGDIVTALASFARADALYARVGYPGRSAGVLASDRCELMITAGLLAEARENGELAVRTLEGVGDVMDLAEARLLLARACLAQNDGDAAYRAAVTAGEEFRAAGRSGWVAISEFVALVAAESAGSSWNDDLAARAERIALDLERLGWRSESSAVRVVAAQTALRFGDARFARDQLQIAARSRDRGRSDRRAAAWLATAQLRAFEGNRGGAKRAAAAGLRMLADHQQTLGATELRVGATAHAERLARLGLQLALDDRRPREVFRWAEHVRANALATPTVHPPTASPLAAALVELRRRRSDLDESRRAGTFDGELEADVRRQELVVRDLARLVGIDASRTTHVAADDLQDRVGSARRLVEFIEADGVIHAVVVSELGYRLHTGLAAAADVRGLVDQVGFGLGRLARSSVSAASQAASLASLTDALAQVDHALLRPLRLGDDELVIVPTGVLHNLPWGGLPSITDRPHSIASSATRWMPPVVPPARPRVVVIAGPRLDDGPGEVAAVRSSFARARTLVGSAATVAAALDLLATADIAHVACHGHFRSDSPMFSSLELVDGPLTVYDLESVGSPPRIVVLPACNAGVAAVSVGDELIGTASALLGIGVGHVVAPVTIVNDVATVDVMRSFHRHLREGDPARALARTRTEIGALDDAPARAAAMSLLCLE